MKKLICILIFLFAAYGLAHGTVLLSDDFDSHADINCNDGGWPPSPWNGASGGCSTSGGDYSMEIKGPGRGGSGKAFYTYVWNGDQGYNANIYNTTVVNGQRTIFIRWYWYISSGISGTANNYIKMWRFRTTTQGELCYFNLNGTGTWPNAVTFQIGAGGFGGWYSIINMGSLSKDTWHYFEVQLTLSSSGANGILRVWIDDDSTPYYENTSVDMGTNGTETFGGTPHGGGAIGLGNRGSATNLQSTPYPIIWDDVVIADTKVGEIGTPTEDCTTEADEDGQADGGACGDTDCDGEIGPEGQTCETDGEETCDDGYDNDADGLTDKFDYLDCKSERSSGAVMRGGKAGGS